MVMLPDRDVPVELHWGIPSNNREVAQIGLLRSETARIERPCLIIANEFGLVNGPREKYRASLITTEKFFCIAGVFHPGHRDWPPCFAALTVAAYPDLEPYKDRSEEHTSELQSLIRNSYAVFCLKKKTIACNQK